MCRLAAAMAVIATAVSCSTGGPSDVASPATPTAPASAAPVTAEINQLRDNYGRQIIAIQLTNTTSGPVTVLGAGLASPLFAGTIEWQGTPGGIELPPGQPKILPAQLRGPACGLSTQQVNKEPVNEEPVNEEPAVELRLAEAWGPGSAATVPAADPYGVLSRNNAEMCLAQAAAAVAAIRLEPELVVSADGQGALMGLTITPRSTPGAVNPGSKGTLTINWIDPTTLLAEDPSAPWPRSVSAAAGGAGQQYWLGIRPARCDPHAVAEDKVGTLLPLRVSVGGRDGVLRVDAGALLRGRIYEFITAACGRQ
ncbi:hypothetical protein J2X01_000098 [Arthrobacter ginsengisoli]|uniref:Uncharacterized protein n=1 Tax=Arthrobacter ginsengisoli TaxID=1356565 RepID=A0ABU1U6L1_9MICC|nr:hypothetical protein [Arthrobacter ginsengisoli]MDR7080829.1 hypothetical protein [Arthrobacter ginsengisoli]